MAQTESKIEKFSQETLGNFSLCCVLKKKKKKGRWGRCGKLKTYEGGHVVQGCFGLIFQRSVPSFRCFIEQTTTECLLWCALIPYIHLVSI